MVEHIWGEEGFDWKGLDDSIYIICRTCRLYARLGCNGKEKYGTARISVDFFRGSLHELIFPGYVYTQFSKQLSLFDDLIFTKIVRLLKLDVIMVLYQEKIYNIAYQKALKAYPHLREEILVQADYPELIEGGMEIHNKYWKTVQKEENDI